MIKKLWVGNLPFSAKEEEVRQLFETIGKVHSVKLIMDRESGRNRGFGFIEMYQDFADQAINKLHETDFGGRSLRVTIAKDQNTPNYSDQPVPQLATV
ncbi:RNA-binding protein [Sulfidibacter corallicola]|uniref:RNA-binding protein n=1 Tax=Sulfidibacter corallicola TaxID=2818388 RepID=A0A8A4TZZ1_SULCO|nr:RNA-binding protein [Sulfidibacter corallicola]QTD52065.1 RNA-binding protein [Sulfidibacter corallicola]